MPPSRAEAGTEASVLHLVNGENIGGIERVVTTLCRFHGRVKARVVCLMDGEMRRTADPRPDLVRMAGRLDPLAAVRVARYVRERGVELIVAHTLRANLVAVVAARLARVPALATVHSPIARDTERPRRNARNAWLQRRLVPWTDGYVTVSESLRREVIAMGAPPARVALVRNGVDARVLGSGDRAAFRRTLTGVGSDTPLVGTLALLRPRKGIEDLLRAAPRVLEHSPSCRFVVAGREERAGYSAALQRVCADLGIAGRVAFTGFCDDVPGFLAALDVFVLPSLFGEGLPLAVLEAMAAGAAVVATDSEGNREAVRDGVTGILVPPGDPGALGRVVAGLAGDPGRRAALGVAARKDAEERFSAERMTAEAETAYLRFLAARTSS